MTGRLHMTAGHLTSFRKETLPIFEAPELCQHWLQALIAFPSSRESNEAAASNGSVRSILHNR